MTKRKIIAAILALAGATAYATDFYVVVPVKGRTGTVITAPPAGAPSDSTPAPDQIAVELVPTTLPSGQVGNSYIYDFKPNLVVTGDPQYTGAGVTWAVSAGTLPAGLQLDAASGVLNGTPTASGTPSFTLTATYRTQSGRQQYTVTVLNNSNLVQFSGYRAWADGSLARSCNEYRYPSSGHLYAGATGDGLYRISPSGTAMNVYCDMTADGGGWTQVMNAVNGQTSGWSAATGALNMTATPDRAKTWKLADSDIQALTATGLRLSSSAYGTTRYVKPICRYSHTAAPTVGNGCGTSYSTLAWADARSINMSPVVALGISDADSSTHAEYFSTNDTRTYAWFAGSYKANDYKSGSGYNGGAGFQMWVK